MTSNLDIEHNGEIALFIVIEIHVWYFMKRWKRETYWEQHQLGFRFIKFRICKKFNIDNYAKLRSINIY
jgi:hypothetical protein